METDQILNLLEQLSISLSLIVLFLTLYCYKYEIMFRILVVIVAVTGLAFPVIYFLPYALILWRVFIGANVVTEKKLYIGQLVNKPRENDEPDSDSFDPSNASTHWIVAVKQGTEEGGGYLITHAIGRVISGEGKKIKFERHDDRKLKSKYILTQVGYLTRKNTEQKMLEVVELEPMKSGYTCQEFAIDIAFQLSGSRTYTFMKTMTIMRFRTVVFYTLLSASVIGYITMDHWLAKIFNAIVICNIFVAVELSRIGVTNTRAQTGYLPVIRAYLRYPKPKNFLHLLLVALVVLVLYYRMGLIESALLGFVMLIAITMKA